MSTAPQLRIREIELYERPVKLRLPFRFGVVTLRHCPQAFVRVRVETSQGSGWGAAAEMMAPKWFDKNLALTNEQNFEQLREVLRIARSAYLSDSSPATAFGHFARHYDGQLAQGALRGFNPLLSSYGPALVDRAVLDALLRIEGVSFYDGMRANLPGIDGRACDAFAGFDFGAFLRQLEPADSIEARHTVGMLDAITAGDVSDPVKDGLPETLEQVIATWGHRYFKLKVGGNLPADVARLEKIAAVLDQLPHPYFVSLDGNEQYADADGVVELVDAIRSRATLLRLWESILFIEQPVARKVALEVDLRRADVGKPVIIDESDGELDTFVRARERGYAGVSSKTCKGFYKSVLNAARCQAWGPKYFMSAEDLTTQAGLAVQQDLALVNLLGISHVERNGHYYVNGLAAQPAGEQQAFLDAHPDVYERSHGAVRLRIASGRIALGSLACAGFASAAMPDFGAMSLLRG